MIENLPHSASILDIETRRSWSGLALIELMAQRSAQLYAQGARTNTNVLINGENAFGMLLDILSVWHLGATAVPITTSFATTEMNRILGFLEPSLVVGGEASFQTPNGGEIYPTVWSGWARDKYAGTSARDSTALILVTSGTSGTPKFVALSQAALLNRLELNIKHIDVSKLERALVLMPLYFGHGLIGNTLTPLFAGGTVFLGAKTDITGSAKLGSLIDELQITFLSSVPSLWRIVLKLSPPPQSDSLQRVHVGSEPMSSKLWRSIDQWTGNADTFNMYGMTEASNWIAGISGLEAGYASGAVGLPWGGEVALRTKCDNLITPETTAQSGEILLKSPSLMTEYVRDKASTREAFIDGWFLTGDLGEFDQGAGLRIIGRLKNQINCAGIKVSAEEVDQLLESHPDVVEACSFAAPDRASGEAVAAGVVLKEGSNLSMEELLGWCKTRIRKEAHPVKIKSFISLAKTSRGKLNRDAIRNTVLGFDIV